MKISVAGTGYVGLSDIKEKVYTCDIFKRD